MSYALEMWVSTQKVVKIFRGTKIVLQRKKYSFNDKIILALENMPDICQMPSSENISSG